MTMVFSTLSDAAIADLQRNEGRYYWSGVADILLSKHGIVRTCPQRYRGPAPALVARGQTERSESWVGGVIEGPLAPQMAQSLGVAPCEHVVRSLLLRTQTGATLGRLQFNAMQVRAIPSRRGELSEPEAFGRAGSPWCVREYAFQSFSAGEGRPVLFADDDSGRSHIVGIRRENATILGIPLADVAVQHHALPPLDSGYYAMSEWSDLYAAERWLIATLVEHGCCAGLPVVTIAPWPSPYRAAFTMRHDFDRPLSAFSFNGRRRRNGIGRLLAAYEAAGAQASWFWRMKSFDSSLIRRIKSKGHEIALHTEAESAPEFASEVAFFRRRGIELSGWTAHGGTGSAGYRGAIQHEAAIAAGMRYGELLGAMIVLPSFAVHVGGDRPVATEVVMPGGHLSLDRSNKEPDHFLDTLLPDILDRLARGYHVVVMNHPDIHIDQVIDLVTRASGPGIWCSSMNEIAAWFRSSRSARVVEAAKDSVTVAFHEPATQPVKLHVRMADADLSVDLPQGAINVEVSRVADTRYRAIVDGRPIPLACTPAPSSKIAVLQ